jgi:hypothetical protein
MNGKTLEIKVSRQEAKPGFYVARYRSPVLGATYTVEFPGTVVGAVALHHFTEMLKTRYPVGGMVRFLLPPDETLHPVLQDVLSVERYTS